MTVYRHMAQRLLKLMPVMALIFFIPMLVTAYAGNAQDLKKSRSAVTEKKQGLRNNSDIQVVMYMTDWCPYCKKAGKYIRSLGVN